MTDWRFGDVLRLPAHGRHGYVLFLGRSYPVVIKPDGNTGFWGFRGLRLPPDCVDEMLCGMSHTDWGRIEALGGHPDARHNDWLLVESLG